MSEVLQRYETVLRGPDGRRYAAQASGRARDDGLWEGWIEFLPLDGGEPVVTARETTQPNRAGAVYWATGITDPYLDGALLRALRGAAPTATAEDPAQFAAEQPAPGAAPLRTVSPAAGVATRAVLDPFHVYGEGVGVLRGQLAALSASQLRNIVRAYRLSDVPAPELHALTQPALIELIVTAVEAAAGQGP